MNKEQKLKMMYTDLAVMNKEQILEQFQLLGCLLPYEDIVKKLRQSYNDLQIADELFATYNIDDSTCKYPKEFIDEGLVWIARHEVFPFLHYGAFAYQLQELMETMLAEAQKLQKEEQLYQQFFKTMRQFQVDNYDALIYAVHDPIDLGSCILTYLQRRCKTLDKEQLRLVINFVDRFFQIFSSINPYMEEQLLYKQATAYILIKSRKGDTMFMEFLSQHPDRSEVLFHYLNALLLIDKKRAKTTYERNHKLIQSDSDYANKIEILISKSFR